MSNYNEIHAKTSIYRLNVNQGTYLKFVKDPGVFEGTFTHFLGFLFELFDGSLVDTTALVDQVTGGGRFTGIDVTDNDDVQMKLFLSHD